MKISRQKLLLNRLLSIFGCCIMKMAEVNNASSDLRLKDLATRIIKGYHTWQ